MDPVKALQAGILGGGASSLLQTNYSDFVDGGSRPASLLTKRLQSNGLASTSRLLLETRRGTSASLPSRRIACHCSAPRPHYRAANNLGPSTFTLTEKILQLWKSQQPEQRKRFLNAVTSSKKVEEVLDHKTSPTSEEADSGGFVWKTNWYPVIPEIDLDKSVPYPFQILGRKVVIWHDGKSGDAGWSCVLDVCPHRLAPLSEGRVDEQGCIQCSYHGWSFRGDGTCANIPQAKKEGPESRACDQSRATAVTLPVVVKQGILFLWPDEDSKELAAQTEPPVTPGIDTPDWCGVGTFRDLPYGYDTGMENLADPSHIPVAHHNVNGGIMGKRSQATSLDLEVKAMKATGFDAERKVVGRPSSIHTFHAPARFTYAFQLGSNEKARGATTTYCTPTSPGNCRIVVVNARNFMIQLSSGPHWWQFFPRWLDHQMMMNLLDGDATLLHGQERYLRDKTHGKVENWNKAYFMPTTADKYVGAFRQWLNRFAGKGVGWAEGVDSSLPPLIAKREDLLDRYTTHTKQCVVCSKAAKNFETARKVFFVSAAILLGIGAVLAQPADRIRAVGFAALAGILGWWMGGWIQMFYYKGYDHARIP